MGGDPGYASGERERGGWFCDGVTHRGAAANRDDSHERVARAIAGARARTYCLSQKSRHTVCPYKTDTFFHLSQPPRIGNGPGPNHGHVRSDGHITHAGNNSHTNGHGDGGQTIESNDGVDIFPKMFWEAQNGRVVPPAAHAGGYREPRTATTSYDDRVYAPNNAGGGTGLAHTDSGNLNSPSMWSLGSTQPRDLGPPRDVREPEASRRASFGGVASFENASLDGRVSLDGQLVSRTDGFGRNPGGLWDDKSHVFAPAAYAHSSRTTLDGRASVETIIPPDRGGTLDSVGSDGGGGYREHVPLGAVAKQESVSPAWANSVPGFGKPENQTQHDPDSRSGRSSYSLF